MIDDIQNLDSSTERMEHDMFEPQPVKGNNSTIKTERLSSTNPTFQGARIYFFHFVFHDWSDHHCHEILTQIAAQ